MQSLTRRQFALGAGGALAGASALGAMGCAGPPAEPGSARSPAAAGPARVTRGGADLRTPRDTPPGETWHYQITLPFQAGPRLAAVFCNIRKAYAPGVDFENGADVIPFDDLARIRPERALALTRNHEEPNPNTTPPGKRSIMVKYISRGGFVPFGARRDDASPHPHAGTGFALNQALAWPIGEKRYIRKLSTYYRGPEQHLYFEVQQLACDGTTFRVLGNDRLAPDRFVAGWSMRDGALTNAIADGDDLLLAMSAGRRADETLSGVMRWRRDPARGWQPADFLPVEGSDGSGEPSLVRDRDGSLLFSARGGRDALHDIRVWRSGDGGRAWAETVHVVGIVGSTPITLNRAADGTPYVAANVYEVPLVPMAERFTPSMDDRGRVRGGGWTREKLYLWPLDPTRTRLAAPVLARDCRTEFGPPPGGSSWNVDRPSAATVRLSDGAWHNVLAFRIVERGEITDGIGPAPPTGAYVEEVLSSGPAVPAWNFGD